MLFTMRWCQDSTPTWTPTHTPPLWAPAHRVDNGPGQWQGEQGRETNVWQGRDDDEGHQHSTTTNSSDKKKGELCWKKTRDNTNINNKEADDDNDNDGNRTTSTTQHLQPWATAHRVERGARTDDYKTRAGMETRPDHRMTRAPGTVTMGDSKALPPTAGRWKWGQGRW